MKQEFKNYTIKSGEIILLLEKDIYSRDMINGAGNAIADKCKMKVTDKKGVYEVVIVFKEGNPEEIAVAFNDALISCVSLFPD